MLIDDVKIKIIAGHGGRGAVAFNKTKMNLGPAGANGGRGGSIFLEGVSNINALHQFRFKKKVEAQNGENGKTQFDDGKSGKDLIIYGDENFSTSLCYVDDVVSGLIKLMAAPSDIGPINLGSNEDLKLLDVAQKIISMTGSESKVVFEKPLLF